MSNEFKTLALSLMITGAILTSCRSPDKKSENAQKNIQDTKEKVDEVIMELYPARYDSIQQFKKELYAALDSY